MIADQRLRFKEMFNTAEMTHPILNLVSSVNHATVSVILIRPEDSYITYPPLPILHKIFNKTEICAYSSPSSIKSSPVDDNTACNLIFASASDPDFPHVVKLKWQIQMRSRLHKV